MNSDFVKSFQDLQDAANPEEKERREEHRKKLLDKISVQRGRDCALPACTGCPGCQGVKF